jgi:hypothetical protein
MLSEPGRYRSINPQTPSLWFNSANKAYSSSAAKGRTPVRSAPGAADKVFLRFPPPVYLCLKDRDRH